MTPERLCSARPPGPDLWSAVPEHACSFAPQDRSEPRVELGVVDEQGRARPPPADGCADFSVREAHSVGSARDFGHAERGRAAEVGGQLDALAFERAATHPERTDAAELREDGRRRAITGGLSGDDEKLAVHGASAPSSVPASMASVGSFFALAASAAWMAAPSRSTRNAPMPGTVAIAWSVASSGRSARSWRQ